MLRLSLFLSFLTLFAVAGELPTIPQPGEDAVLLQGKTAREFFAARAGQQGCVSDMEQAKGKYLASKRELERLVAAQTAPAAVDKQNDRMRADRTRYLSLVEQCGPCATVPVERREMSEHGQVWYVSHGSCQLPSTQKDELEKAFVKMTDVVKHLHQYPRQKGGVFTHILNATAVDNTSGKLLPEIDALSPEPGHTYMTIFGPELPALGLGKIQTAFSYYLRAQYEQRENGGLKEFAYPFQTVTPPTGFRIPSSLAYLTASGQKKFATNKHLHSVIGQWYLNSDGYLFYYTAADFTLSMKFIEELGRTIQLETVVDLMEKGLPE